MNQINGKTSFIGLIGQPVEHSLSPIIHNAALEKLKLNWCYLALPCSPCSLKEVLNGLKRINCKGLNITIPHKKNAINYCSKICTISHQIGSINTLITNEEGEWEGFNTDLEGFIYPIKQKNWNNCDAIVLGNGGSCRAVIAGLQKLKFKNIIVIGRNHIKLNNFLDEFKKKASFLKSNQTLLKGVLDTNSEIKQLIKDANLIVNATPVGMSGCLDSKNLDIPLGEEIWENLNQKTVLYDLIYTPKPTKWLKIGSKNGCQVIDGLEMLIQQGASSLSLWSGINEIPINAMREAALKELSRKEI